MVSVGKNSSKQLNLLLLETTKVSLEISLLVLVSGVGITSVINNVITGTYLQ